jgi:hypothetical protein
MSIDTRPGTARRAARPAAAQHSRTPSAHRSVVVPTPAASVSAPSVSVTSRDMIRAGVVETTAHEELVLERVTPNVLRVSIDERVLGFVEHVGRVHVALAGPHYDRAVEVAQTLDVAAAARALA